MLMTASNARPELVIGSSIREGKAAEPEASGKSNMIEPDKDEKRWGASNSDKGLNCSLIEEIEYLHLSRG